MKLRTIRYYIREAFRSIIVNRFMSIASIFAVASSIFIVAVFYIIGANMEFFMHQLEEQMGIAVFINLDITPGGQVILENRIRSIPNVSDVHFVCRYDALEDMTERMTEELMRGLRLDNPLPDAFSVELSDLIHHDQVEHAIRELTAYGVDGIRSAAETAQVLSTISGVVSIVSALLVIVLAAISIIIITNTIRITVNARKTEINIMKYVGATDWFIRWPFVIEGMIIGLLGGAVPAFICMFGYSRVVGAIADIPQLQFIMFMPEEHIMMYVFPMALILGMAIGLLGSITSVKRHLKV